MIDLIDLVGLVDLVDLIYLGDWVGLVDLADSIGLVDLVDFAACSRIALNNFLGSRMLNRQRLCVRNEGFSNPGEFFSESPLNPHR